MTFSDIVSERKIRGNEPVEHRFRCRRRRVRGVLTERTRIEGHLALFRVSKTVRSVRTPRTLRWITVILPMKQWGQM